MNFKPEFIKTLSVNISEAEKKEYYPSQSKNKVIPKHSSKSTANNNNSSTNNDQSNKDKTFYDLLVSIHGFQEFADFILKRIEIKAFLSPKSESEKMIIPNLNVSLNTEQKNQVIEKELEAIEVDEFALMNIFKEIYNEVYEFKIYELFEIYEMKPNAKLGFREIYLIITFSAAVDCGQVLEYLYLFGNILFNYLSCGKNEVYGIRLRQFAKLIGFSERNIGKHMKEIQIIDHQKHTLEDFELLMFALFEEKEINSNESPEKITKNQIGKPMKKEGGFKYKTCKSLCHLF